MYLQDKTFDHTASCLAEAIGVTNSMRITSREKIFFATIANYLQGRELYEDPEEIPAEFHTKTGDLSRALKLIDNQLEYEYSLITFMRFQEMAQEVCKKHNFLNSSEVSESDKSKLKIVDTLKDMMLQHQLIEKKEENPFEAKDVNQILPSNLMQRIDLVKQSQYNWNTYFKMVKTKGLVQDIAGSDFDVDGFLHDIMGRMDD